jgi:toprim domain protein
MNPKVIIVEGKTDKEKILDIIDEPVEIICTYGTLDREWLEEREEALSDQEIYILVDADEAGIKLRRELTRALPNARHLYTRKMYREVARTPIDYLVKMLDNAHFTIAEKYRMLLR